MTGLYSIRCLFVFTLGVLFNFQGANTLANQGLVDLGGLEPPTSRLSGVRSNLLSYEPISLAVSLFRSALFPLGWWR